ncbi:hypothetical protein GINT2_000168 [Glugoides intestinalis]
MENEYKDLLHSGALDNLENYTIFRRRYPSKGGLPMRYITEWYLQEIPAHNRAYSKWICLVGIYKDKVVRTSPIISIISPRKICTCNCIYTLGTTTKLLQHPFLGVETRFFDGFPVDWEKIIESAFCQIHLTSSPKIIQASNVGLQDPILNEVVETAIVAENELAEDSTSLKQQFTRVDSLFNSSGPYEEPLINKPSENNEIDEEELLVHDFENQIETVGELEAVGHVEAAGQTEAVQQEEIVEEEGNNEEYKVDSKTINDINETLENVSEILDLKILKEFPEYEDLLQNSIGVIAEKQKHDRYSLKASSYPTVDEFMLKNSPFKSISSLGSVNKVFEKGFSVDSLNSSIYHSEALPEKIKVDKTGNSNKEAESGVKDEALPLVTNEDKLVPSLKNEVGSVEIKNMSGLCESVNEGSPIDVTEKDESIEEKGISGLEEEKTKEIVEKEITVTKKDEEEKDSSTNAELEDINHLQEESLSDTKKETNLSISSSIQAESSRPSIRILIKQSPHNETFNKSDDRASNTPTVRNSIEAGSFLNDFDSMEDVYNPELHKEDNQKISKRASILEKEKASSLSNLNNSQVIKKRKTVTSQSEILDETVVSLSGKDEHECIKSFSLSNQIENKQVLPIKVVSSLEQALPASNSSANKSLIKNKKKKTLLVMPKKLKTLTKKSTKK